ncbi:cytochrome c [Cohaesibacter sp. CAU 1516]|uniref:c-type cytochrome n=1 Tax=Cohaesibacter sp. CAU 1516 TaxID=2576038 RepID=UPI0010FE240A|nr:cytochrome c [Cohaesibacter sp. CAU 1516]TLP41911.1 cytochrome c [Cohaesibacter sp. CAU 1516]
MKKLFVTAAVALSVSASIVLPVSVLAHGGATGEIKERMDAMSSMGKAVKVLKDIMQGKTDYDADAVRKQAAIIKSHAGDALTDGFPEGSLKMPSEAKAEIWTDWEKFSQLASQLETFATGLEGAADNGLMMGKNAGSGMGAMMGKGAGSMMGKQAPMMGSGMGTANAADHITPERLAQMPAEGVFTMMVQVCSACHTDYRAEKK